MTNNLNLSYKQKLAEKHKAHEDMLRAVEENNSGFRSLKNFF